MKKKVVNKKKVISSFKKELIHSCFIFLIMVVINKFFNNHYNLVNYLLDLIPPTIYGITMFGKDLLQIKFLKVCVEIINKRTEDPFSYIYEKKRTPECDRKLLIKLKMGFEKGIFKRKLYRILKIDKVFISISDKQMYSKVSIQPLLPSNVMINEKNCLTIDLTSIIISFLNSDKEHDTISVSYNCLFNLERDENIDSMTYTLNTDLIVNTNTGQTLNSFYQNLLFDFFELGKSHEIRIRR